MSDADMESEINEDIELLSAFDAAVAFAREHQCTFELQLDGADGSDWVAQFSKNGVSAMKWCPTERGVTADIAIRKCLVAANETIDILKGCKS